MKERTRRRALVWQAGCKGGQRRSLERKRVSTVGKQRWQIDEQLLPARASAGSHGTRSLANEEDVANKKQLQFDRERESSTGDATAALTSGTDDHQTRVRQGSTEGQVLLDASPDPIHAEKDEGDVGHGVDEPVGGRGQEEAGRQPAQDRQPSLLPERPLQDRKGRAYSAM
jgi:hypothetical protein